MERARRRALARFKSSLSSVLPRTRSPRPVPPLPLLHEPWRHEYILQIAVAAIKDLNDRSGVSLPQFKAYFAANKKGYKNHMLLKALKAGIESGKLATHHQKKGSYKLGPKAAAPKKKAPKKKVAK